MKKVLLLTIINFLLWNIQAQTCMPDSMYADSSAGVFPAPITMDNPDGGIDRAACIGEYYEYPLTVVIPDSATFTIAGFPVSVDLISAQIEPEGAIQGLPPGIDYICMPEDCVYPSETIGCILLYGTVEEDAEAGRYPLFIDLQVTIVGLGTLDITFPGAQFPGQYYLDLAPSDSSLCTSSLQNGLFLSHKLYPNPIVGNKRVYVQDHQEINELEILSLNGQSVRKYLKCPPSIDLNDLAPGIYLALYRDTERSYYQKLSIAP